MRKILPFWSQVRNYTAIASAFIYNLNIFGVSAKNICAPGFNCHGCPWATFSCPVGIIGYGFGLRSIPAFALGSVLATGIILGRLICGYACPFGLLQELLYRIRTKKFSLPRWLRYTKYVVLLLFVFLLTYIFGFEALEGYVRIYKPVVAKDVPELDQSIFAEKNRSYFTDPKYAPVMTAGGLPVLPGLQPTGGSGGLKPVGLGAAGLAGGGDSVFSSLGDIAGETGDDPLAQEKGGDDGDVLGSLVAESERMLSAPLPQAREGESTLDFMKRSQEEAYADTELLVEVTIENLSDHPLENFVLTPVFYEHGTGEELWRGEDKEYHELLPAGEKFTTEIFTVPYYLHKADLAVLSAQTAVELDYWNLFCTYCPVAAIEADAPNKLAGISDSSEILYAITRINTPRLLITLAVIILSVLISRFFCRTLCPLGAMYALLARFAVLKVVLDKDKCIDCGNCDRVCPAELDVRREVGTAECLACGDCVRACPVSALKRKAGL